MIIIFGSINMDVYINVRNFPQSGEAVISRRYIMHPGGKGANQALASARCGAKTALVGKVGDDGMGHRVLNNLRRNEVMTSGVAKSESLPTGMAFIARNKDKENMSIVAMGANATISNEQVPDEILGPDNMVVMQMEVPREENVAIMERAKINGAKVVLNLAPAIEISEAELRLVDYLIVNQIEARQLAELLKINAVEDSMKLAQALSKLGKLTCIVTMGRRGSVCVTESGEAWDVDAMKLETVVDKAGSGDCYTGTFAACIYNKKPLPEALRIASVAAGMCCMNKGAQDSYPYIGDVEDGIAAVDFPESITI